MKKSSKKFDIISLAGAWKEVDEKKIKSMKKEIEKIGQIISNSISQSHKANTF